MAQPSLLIVLDGPAGAGKSTVAAAVAQRFSLPLLDTGAIYRTLAWVARDRGIAWDDADGLTELAQDFALEFSGPATAQRVSYGGRDLTAEIRTPEISRGASEVSVHAGVRQALMGIQQRIGARGCVAEGRDMGTVVFPEAPHKFFLTADLETRAQRRLKQLEAAGGALPSLDVVVAEVQARDARDRSRDAAPLRQAEDATLVDSSGLAVSDIVERIVSAVEQGHSRPR